uniref:SCP domain-containing protein n=1 Tax=Strongyloides venezuelensis TaxID=75913 RepID=A0A0K0FIY7_STRVS
MHISIIVYVSIPFIINLVKTQELAVTYMKMYMRRNRKFYSYRERMYFTFKQMIEEIFKDHRPIDPRYLLITKIASLGNNGAYIPEQRKYKNATTGTYETHISPYLITEYYIRNSLKYVCNGETFNSYRKALEYAMEAKRHDHSVPTGIPSSPLLPPIDSNSLVYEKIYCRKFWWILWEFCDYHCYSSDNFKVMKKKFLLELNYYRAKYGAKPLVEDQYLSSAAQRLLTKVVLMRTKIDITKLENIGKGTLITAPLILNKWFGEHKLYNHKNFGNPKTKHFTAMVWKSVTSVGFGIMRVGNEIFVKLIYYKKVNMPNQYEEIVLEKVSRRSGSRRL